LSLAVMRGPEEWPSHRSNPADRIRLTGPAAINCLADSSNQIVKNALHPFERRHIMILGMSTATYTFLHVLISLIGIGSGLIVMYGFLSRKRLDSMTAVFLVTTVLTSVTGFGFPVAHLLPSHIVGIISLVALAIAIPARYGFHLEGRWRSTFVVSASIALYLNVFVLVVQLFEKVPALKALAPTQSEPPFKIVQLLVLALFIALTVISVKKFRPAELQTFKRAA
jgi:hypothetical protein